MSDEGEKRDALDQEREEAEKLGQEDPEAATDFDVPAEMPKAPVFQTGVIDRIIFPVDPTPGTGCVLIESDEPSARCCHPVHENGNVACADLRQMNDCPLVKRPVLLMAERAGQIETEIVVADPSSLMHCANCGCNLQVTQRQLETMDAMVCPSCSHVVKDRTGPQGG
jgi:hypothetical protein